MRHDVRIPHIARYAHMSRHDHRLRWSRDPEAIALAEETAEDMAHPDEGDNFGWCASLAEDRETRWREGA